MTHASFMHTLLRICVMRVLDAKTKGGQMVSGVGVGISFGVGLGLGVGVGLGLGLGFESGVSSTSSAAFAKNAARILH